MKKFKGIWPLYGGMRNYVLTLRKILERINQENPTMVQLVSWLRSEYKVSSKTVPYGMLRVVSKCLGFMQEVGGRVKLTPTAEEFLRTSENRLVLGVLKKRVLGFAEVLQMLAESQPLSLTEIHEGLLKRCNLDWATTTQTMYRLNWLISLGFVDKEYKKYRLTDKDLVTAEEKKGRPPIPHPPTPIDDFVKHAKGIIERHPTMDESNTISTMIEPLLEALGWNIRDPDEVQREYAIRIGEKTEYVDIALKINSRPVLFIEAKSVGTPLRNHLAEQPLRYANAEGVSWCVLMNGRELRVYNAFWKIKGIERKMLFKLLVDDLKEKISTLLLLSKGNVISGKLDEEGEFEHAKRITSEWLRQKENTIVKSIMELDPSLKEDYVRRVLRKIL
ncbi:MAG: type I restriction endonuclease [Candidatus Bathyarchaeota archaeon]|nr:type I restriction endonuclease [Candidatus Bathyarchaeota archaeon]